MQHANLYPSTHARERATLLGILLALVKKGIK